MGPYGVTVAQILKQTKKSICIIYKYTCMYVYVHIYCSSEIPLEHAVTWQLLGSSGLFESNENLSCMGSCEAARAPGAVSLGLLSREDLNMCLWCGCQQTAGQLCLGL